MKIESKNIQLNIKSFYLEKMIENLWFKIGPSNLKG